MRSKHLWIFTLILFGCEKWNLDKLPTLTTLDANKITSANAESGGNISSDGGAPITQRGVCWSVDENPTTVNNKTSEGSGTGNYVSILDNLQSNTTYYVRAYATNKVGTSYGNQVSFTALLKSASLTTLDATKITSASAESGGNISSDGGATITQRGVCWSKSSNPTIANNKTNDGSGIASFTSSIIGLSSNTTYYVRAYATNKVGTSYGNQVSFTTLKSASLTTLDATKITSVNAESGGNITSDGGAPITQRGVCWSKSSNPTIANNKTNDGSGIGSFTSSIIGLSSNTTYFVRAYATNSIGTAYGSEISFTTLIDVPSVTTGSVSNIVSNTADVDGNITDLGNASVTDHGHCWSTSTNPTVNNSKSSLGSASSTGAFTSNLTGLSNTTYFVRAYATNSYGTSYGKEISFTPVCNVPTVSTIGYKITPVPPYWKVEVCGRVTDEGSFPVSNVIMYFNKTNPPGAGCGIGYPGLNIDFCCSPLKSAGTYYIQADAENSCGSGLGSVIQVTVP